MNIYDFVSKTRFDELKKYIEKHDDFEHHGSFKKGKHQIDVTIYGSHVDEDKAVNIWHGNDYLVHFSSNLSGGGEYMGFSGATDDLSFSRSWDDFKAWVDKKMTYYKDYETEVYGQLCIF